MFENIWIWVGFTGFVLAMLALDLGVFQRKSHVIGMKEALVWFGVWVGLALVFNIGLIFFHERGTEAGLEFFTGFLVEKALSIDNVFVFILIFGYFNVPSAFQHKVLFWGIIGALIFRIFFILGGMALMEQFHWTIYLFGGFLLATGIGMLRKREHTYDPEKNWVIRQFRRFFPISERYDGNRFFSRIDGRLVATPLFLVLLAIESSDIIFAADSIPAIFAITSDPFVVYTSNIFAMLGLRALYFAVSGFMKMFHFLHYGFASIIIILGVKMLISDFYHLPVGVSLALIVVILLICVIVSLLRPRAADLKMLFGRTERLGLIPFRRLLLIENIIDLARFKARDVMRERSLVRCLNLNDPWEENRRIIHETQFSRYPVRKEPTEVPTRIVHIKSILFAPDPARAMDSACRTALRVKEDAAVEDVLALFQKTCDQMALVVNADNQWTGIVTLEDILEEIVGKMGDEFDRARHNEFLALSDSFTPQRVVFSVQANNMNQAIDDMVSRIPPQHLPCDPRKIIQAVKEREKTMPTYLGRGLAIPHGRLDEIDQPLLIFGRSDEGIPQDTGNERAYLLFMLLTPTRIARFQPRLLADIVGLMESEYVVDRLKNASTPEEVVEAVRAGQQVVLD